MEPLDITGPEVLPELVGRKVGPTEWREVTQEMINTFAELSGDHQWIHVDVERAKTESPSPVPAGSKVRANAEMISSEDLGNGWIHNVTRFTVEVEGSDKPCCVADSVTRLLKA